MQKKKILIVDDDPDVVETLRKWLEHSHFECLCCYSVEEAFPILKEKAPDLVILDLGFAKTNGTAFLKHGPDWIEKGRPMPPVIVLSGYADREIISYVMGIGARGFVKKPYDINALVSMVHDYINEEPSGSHEDSLH